ncbi:MAG: S41 family peptidase [Bacteroidaceae bacterium]|jgi:carboxyl-terminal processing protease|nr:S41 family peptidase [Bacteroidaceae bacterium]
MSQNKSTRFIPLIIAISVVIGVLLGTFYAHHFSGNKLSIINTSSNKLNDLLHIIDDQYVDTVDLSNLVERAMPEILGELDPHSIYIPAQKSQEATDELAGSFSGIGVQFTIRQDTIYINNVIKGGPSEKVGLLAGDRIIKVDGEDFTGEIVTNEEVLHRLKGEKGSEVKLTVLRRGQKEFLDFTVVRGDIPVNSIKAAYMINKEVGYMQIEKFGETTYPEMLVGLAKLNQANFKGLIIDLRGNTGGYMGAAIQMVNEFLPANRLIVYTEGRKSARQEYKSDGRGGYQNLPLVVLVDEASASASEIFSGAIQDNDRGVVVGRRTFGKGLVQEQVEFGDHSMIRLTIARYYTPSGRCVQKPYKKGHDEDYEMDILTRYQRGEFFSEDSIKQSGTAYETSIGRKIYGGGGIMPDYFVPQDTVNYTSYFRMANQQGFIIQYAYEYTDDNRQALSKYDTYESLVKYLASQNIVDKFANYANKKGLKRRNLMLQKSMKLFEHALYGNIVYIMLDDEEYAKFANESDPTVLKAVNLLKNNEAWPQAPKP